MSKGILGRRRFLRLSAGAGLGWAGAMAAGCGASVLPPAGSEGQPVGAEAGGTSDDAIFVPKVNDGINIHPLRRLDAEVNDQELVIVPELVALQLRTVYELGFDGIRLTAPFGSRANLLGAIPYVRAARALGIDACVVLSTFAGLTPAQALWSGEKRPEMLGLFNQLFAAPPLPAGPDAGGLGPKGVGRIAFQILNEPALFFGLPPDVYVREFLIPSHAELKRLNPQVIVVAAAEVGTEDGPARVRAMLEAGLEGACDRVAYHIYGTEVLERLPEHIRSVVWITESGAAPTSAHARWVREVFPAIKTRLVDATRIFFYDLFDNEPGRHRILNIRAGADGGYEAIVESPEVYAYWQQVVAEKAAGRPLRAFSDLIPDITAYFPTAADIAAYDEVAQL
jgi:hypothetical protein